MEVIQDIVNFLFLRDELTPQDMRRLAANDLLAGTLAGVAFEPLYGFSNDDGAPPVVDTPADPGERLQSEFDRAPRGRCGQGRHKPTLSVMARLLSLRLRDCFAKAASRLDVLRTLAAVIGPATNRTTALTTLASASDATLTAAIRTLRAQSSRDVDRLWEVVVFRGYEGLREPEDRGGAVVAYEAILNGATRADLGRYATALPAPGLAELMLLVTVQRHLLACLKQV